VNLGDPTLADWYPPVGLLSWHERHRLTLEEQRTLARNRLGFYEILCGRCHRLDVVHRNQLDDGAVWECPDCRRVAS
jgi:hypothetical protein